MFVYNYLNNANKVFVQGGNYMKIVNKKKFIKTTTILIGIIIGIIFFTKATYSKGQITYTEEYICSGDTLWSIANKQINENKYFKGKDIRYVINEIKEINNLETCNLYEGTKIIIPSF